jgi:hypothetical protein
MEYFLIFILFSLVMLCIILIIVKSQINKKLEGFDNSSLLKEYEEPYNIHNQGYYNTGSTMPPLVPLYSYESMRQVNFPVSN